MLLSPQTDSARKAMLETVVHGVVSVAVIGCSTFLAAAGAIDSAAWAAAVGAGIAASGAVSVLQSKATNGHITEEVLGTMPGGRRSTDPPLQSENKNESEHVKQQAREVKWEQESS